MSEPVVLALIACSQGVLVAALGVVGVVLSKVRRDTAAVRVDAGATREQVVNHHDTNMREENDGRHAETAAWFRELRRDIGGIREELRGVRQDQRHLSRRVDRIDRKDEE